jgi:hypothetical protein
MRASLKFALGVYAPADLRNLLLIRAAYVRGQAAEYDDTALEAESANLRKAADEVNDIISSGECYKVEQLAVTMSDLRHPGLLHLIKTEAAAQKMLNQMLKLVIENPAFNTRQRLGDLVKNLNDTMTL